MIRSLTLALLVASVGASAAQIRGGRYDAATDRLLLDVSYGGGCGTHDFDLEFSGICMMTSPARTSAQLVHETDDPCEAYISRTISLPLDAMKGCRPAYLTVTGDHGSHATVLVPAAN